MNHPRYSLASLSLVIVLCLSSVGLATSPEDKREILAKSKERCTHGYVPEGYMAFVSPSSQARSNAAARSGGQSAAKLLVERYSSQRSGSTFRAQHVFEHGRQGVAFTASARVVQQLLVDDEVDYIEHDCIIQLDDLETQATFETSSASSNSATEQTGLPASLWGLDSLDGTYPDSIYEHGGIDGNGVRVYVLDSGTRISHSEFGGRALSGWSASTGSRWRTDGVIEDSSCSSHGTHTASTIAGTTYGVAKQATIIPVQVLDCSGIGAISTIVAGMQWVLDDMAFYPDSKAVVSMSLGGSFSITENSMVNTLTQSDVVVVASAGNANEDACTYSPASAYRAITVASMQSNLQLSSFTNWGTCVDIIAPGSSVLGAYSAHDNDYAIISGTSMAAPHVSGVVAQIRALRPSLSATEVKRLVLCHAKSNEVTSNMRGGTPNSRLVGVEWINAAFPWECTSSPPPPSPPSPPPYAPGATQEVEIQIRTDSFPGEVSWTITPHAPGYTPISGTGSTWANWLSYDYVQLPYHSFFDFTLHDAGGNGISYPGFWKVKVAGVDLLDEAGQYYNFGSSVTYTNLYVGTHFGAYNPKLPEILVPPSHPSPPSPPPEAPYIAPPPSPPPPLEWNPCWPVGDGSLTCDAAGETARIVGGCALSEPRQFPFLATLQAGGTSHFCGGTLIAARWVLTAGHCLYTAAFVVKLGVDDKTLDDQCVYPHQVKRVIIHPNFDQYTMENDIALIELTTDSIYEPVETYNRYRYAPSTLDAAGSQAVVAGWGTTSFGGSLPNQAMKVSVPITDDLWCQEKYAEGKGVNSDIMICAGLATGGKDACQGDSGGPLFARDPSTNKYVQLGIVSWGDGCAQENKPGVYTRISAYQAWICAETGISTSCYTADQPKSPPAPPSPPSPPMFPTSMITVNVVPDGYPSEVSWKLFVSGIETIVSASVTGGDYEVRAGECYTFEIRDAYGDGICCSYGEGSYEVYMDGVMMIAGRGDFGSVHAESFGLNCGQSVDAPPPMSDEPQTSPSPPAPNRPPLLRVNDWEPMAGAVLYRSNVETAFDFQQRCSRACYGDVQCVGFVDVVSEDDRTAMCGGSDQCCPLYARPSGGSFSDAAYFQVLGSADAALNQALPQRFVKADSASLDSNVNPTTGVGQDAVDERMLLPPSLPQVDQASSSHLAPTQSESISPAVGIAIFVGLFLVGLLAGYFAQAAIRPIKEFRGRRLDGYTHRKSLDEASISTTTPQSMVVPGSSTRGRSPLGDRRGPNRYSKAEMEHSEVSEQGTQMTSSHV